MEPGGIFPLDDLRIVPELAGRASPCWCLRVCEGLSLLQCPRETVVSALSREPRRIPGPCSSHTAGLLLLSFLCPYRVRLF